MRREQHRQHDRLLKDTDNKLAHAFLRMSFNFDNVSYRVRKSSGDECKNQCFIECCIDTIRPAIACANLSLRSFKADDITDSAPRAGSGRVFSCEQPSWEVGPKLRCGFEPLLRDSNFSFSLKYCGIRDFQAFLLTQLCNSLQPDEVKIDVLGPYWIHWIQRERPEKTSK
jgi:hypothetical protein